MPRRKKDQIDDQLHEATRTHPTTQDPEIAHSEPQEGAKLAEEDNYPT